MADIRVTRDDAEPFATVTISNPDRRNAIGTDGTRDLADSVRELDRDDAVRCVVLTGEGEAFCAGADLASASGRPTAGTIDSGFHEAVRALMTCRVPVIARVRGPAIGAGASLATACDLVYAGESARIGFAFTNIGLTADSGATFILPRLVGVQTAMDLLASGDILDAEAAADVGLVARVVPDDELDDRVRDRAVELATGPTRALGAIRRLLLRANANTLEEHLELEAREQALVFHTDDAMEGLTAFMEGRDPEFEGR